MCKAILTISALWVYADGNGKDADIYQLDTSSVSSDVFKEANVELAYDEKTYTGKALKPALPVKYDGKTLKNGKDYTVSYKNKVTSKNLLHGRFL